MSDDTIVASERASSGSSSSDHDSLANLLGRTDNGAAQKNEPVRDPAPEGTHENNTYDLTNPNLHHGTLSEVVYRIPIQEQQFGSSSSYVAQPASTPTPIISESFQLAVGDSGPTATAIANQSADEGQAFSLNVSSHFTAPAAGDTLTFTATLPAGLSINAQTGVISGTPTDGDFGTNNLYGFTFTGFDNTFTVTGQLTVGTSLDAVGGYDVTGITGSVIGPNGGGISSLINNPGNSQEVTSPDGIWIYDNVLYSGSSPLLDYGGILFTSNTYEYNIYYQNGNYILESLNPKDYLNEETGSFTISNLYPSQTITVTATDAHGMAVSESFQLAVGDSGPTATAIANQSADEGQPFTLNVSTYFTAPAVGDALTFTATLPAGLSINAQTGIISGTLTNSDYGNNPITVTATDAHGMAVSETFQLAVGDSGPTDPPIPNQSANEGQAFALDVSTYFAAPAAGDTLTFTATLPAGLSIDAHTGIISGTPTDSDFGNNPITVTATDAHGMALSESFQLAVDDSGPTATTIANQSANEGQAFSLDVSNHFTAPAAGDALTYSATLPAGLSIDAHTGIISGTPTNSDYGSNPITVTATDAHSQSIDETFNLAVSNNNDRFYINSHSGNVAITGSASWTDSIDLHNNIGQKASLNMTEFAADGHAGQSWTGLVTDGSVQSDHNHNLIQGDHAAITINHTDDSATDHIALQHIDHIRY